MAAVKYMIPGDAQMTIIQAAIADGKYTSASEGQGAAARRANGNGYLSRDPKDGRIWYPTEKASAMLAFVAEREAAAEAAVPALAGRDMFDLVATVLRAQKAFDAGDVMAAKQLAGGAYLDSKARAQYAASFGASGKRVVAKARQLQGDALLIETRAKMSIAAAWDVAQAEGRASKGGRPSETVPDGNGFTSEEAGLSRKEIHEARKLLAAEQREPGIAERAIAARVNAGLEPSRANLRAAVGTASATKEERGNNLYQTGPEAMHALLALERFSQTVLEPACGPGAIARMLEADGHDVVLSDLIDYGTTDRHGTIQEVCGFLELTPGRIAPYLDPEQLYPDIVTNPPYGEVLNAFVAHALRVFKPRKMALLLNIVFLGGTDDDDRTFALEDCPPARIYIFKRRLPMMHREGWDGPKADSRMLTAWFVWERDEQGNYGDTTVMRRVDWKDFQPVADVVAEAAE
ncbi:MAG: hypothetical protein JWM58_556 [Rhizobium sp.]|nr:hypothetical protein [Rhizobium sp.]